MKYIKLLLIVALAAIVSVSCDKGEAEWTGGGDAEIFFGIKDKPAIKNETRLVETSRVFTQIPITYINEPYSFPFSIDIEVVKVTDDIPLAEVLMITATKLHFIKGPEFDDDGNPIIMTKTSYLEVQPVNAPHIDKDVEIIFRITGQPDGVTPIEEYKEYTLTITNANN